MKKLLSIVNILEKREVNNNMKRAIFNLNKMLYGMVIQIILIIFIISAAADWAYAQMPGASGFTGSQTGGLTQPPSGGTIGPVTSPVSSYMKSTFQSPQYNPSAGNLLVTGNVGGGRGFRGSVPYGAPQDYRVGLPTTSIDNFLRYSSPAGQPFYSPTGSPLSTNPVGTISAAKAPSEKIKENIGNETFLTSPIKPISPFGSARIEPTVPLSGYSYQSSLLGRVQGYRAANEFMPMGISTEQLPPSDKLNVFQQQPELTTGLTKLDIDILRPFETPAMTAKVVQEDEPQKEMNMELESIRKILKEQQDKEEADKLIENVISDKWQSQMKDVEKPAGLKSYLERTARGGTSSGTPAEPVIKTTVTEEGTTEQPRKFAQDANVYDKEFNDKMQAAKKLMEEGKFYQAVDAYTYATLYKPVEPSGYVGKALALFAAGEYMSSAQLLSAGLKLSADYAKVKYDLSKLIADKNKLQARLRDLDKSSADSLRADLFYLMAYICLQTEQMAKAQQAIEMAVKAAPDDTVVADLKKIIDESRSTR